VGAWVIPQDTFQTGITYYPDGIWVQKFTPAPRRTDYNYIEDGTWDVKEGFIIRTTSKMTQARHPDTEYGIEHFKVIRIDGDSLIFRPSGETNLVTWKRL